MDIETKQLFTKLFTRFDDAFKEIAGRFDGIDKRFEAIDARFDSIDERFEAIDARFDGIDERFEAIDARFDGIDRRLDAVDKRFDGIDQRLDGMDKRFDAIDGQLISIRADLRRHEVLLDENSQELKLAVRTFQTLHDYERGRLDVAREGLDRRLTLVERSMGTPARPEGL
jgi:archaellum component FlaC